jgi:hypothetical protein
LNDTIISLDSNFTIVHTHNLPSAASAFASVATWRNFLFFIINSGGLNVGRISARINEPILLLINKIKYTLSYNNKYNSCNDCFLKINVKTNEKVIIEDLSKMYFVRLGNDSNIIQYNDLTLFPADGAFVGNELFRFKYQDECVPICLPL